MLWHVFRQRIASRHRLRRVYIKNPIRAVGFHMRVRRSITAPIKRHKPIRYPILTD